MVFVKTHVEVSKTIFKGLWESQTFSVPMPADSRCDKYVFEIVFEIAGAKLWKNMPVKKFRRLNRAWIRGRELNTTFFVSNFSGTPGTSRAKSWDIPPKTLSSLGFEGHTELFCTPPLHVEDPHPTRRYPDQDVWVWVPFSSLINCLGGHFGAFFQTFRFTFRFGFGFELKELSGAISFCRGAHPNKHGKRGPGGKSAQTLVPNQIVAFVLVHLGLRPTLVYVRPPSKLEPPLN